MVTLFSLQLVTYITITNSHLIHAQTLYLNVTTLQIQLDPNMSIICNNLSPPAHWYLSLPVRCASECARSAAAALPRY